MSTPHLTSPRLSLLAVIAPGILVAATGIGAGDLATASFAGSHLGVAILWAVVVGGVLKFILTEGLARWQLSTGETFLEGLASRVGRGIGWLFLPYLVLWSFFVGAALMAACGVTLHAIFPVFEDASQAKVVFGIACSVLGVVLVLLGGFKLFEKIMAICIGVMFTTVIVTAVILWPGTEAVVKGLFIPSIPDASGQGIVWTIALLGGVGGTLTILCYGYWIREKGRTTRADIRTCRIDLSVGYTMTILFGLAMVIIGSTVEIEGKGAGLLVTLADRLEEPLGPIGRWFFLVGAFGAVFSSLLGVWQAIPYLFADVWRLFFQSSNNSNTAIDTRAWPYRGYLFAIALLPMAGLMVSFQEIQKFYAVIGAAFIPLLALALLYMNSKRAWLGADANRWPTILMLSATLIFFAGMAGLKWLG